MLLLDGGYGVHGKGKFRMADPEAPGRGRRIDLAADRVAAIGDGAVRTVACRKGAVWLTQEGDIRDHFLRAGEVLVVVNRKHVMVQALEDAQIEIGELI